MELNSVYLSNSFSRVLNGVSRQYDKDTMNCRSKRTIYSFPLSNARVCDSPLLAGEKVIWLNTALIQYDYWIEKWVTT